MLGRWAVGARYNLVTFVPVKSCTEKLDSLGINANDIFQESHIVF